MTRRKVWLLGTGSAALFLLLACTTLRRVAPSAETALWVSTDQRTVSRVSEGSGGRPRLQLAGPVSQEAGGTVSAELEAGWTEQRLGPIRVIHSLHRYRTELRLGGLRIPWMVNDYTAAFPDWLPMLLYRATGRMEIGEGANLLLAALLVGFASGWAARRRGVVAGALVGLLLATDLWFHIYKKLLGSTEVWLQGLALLLIVLVLDSRSFRGRRHTLLVAGLSGLGLSVKVTFVGVLAPVLLAALLLRRAEVPANGPKPRRWRGRWALVILAFSVGFSPTWTMHLIRSSASEVTTEVAGHDTLAGRLIELNMRLKPRKVSPGIRKQSSPYDFLFSADAYWRGLYRLKGELSNHSPELSPDLQREIAGAAGRGPVALSDLGAPAHRSFRLHRIGLGALFFLVLLGFVRGTRLERVLLPTALCVLLLAWALHGDAHHLALGTPLLALAFGVVAARGLEKVRGRSRILAGLLCAALVLGMAGRLSALYRFDTSVSEGAGRLLVRQNIEKLTEVLEAEGARNPAVLTYELVALLEGMSGGSIRPWMWWKANLLSRSSPTIRNGSAEWLRLLLRSHRGGYLLVASGPPSGPGTPAGVSWFDGHDLKEAGQQVGIEPRAVRELRDSEGRWYATLWALQAAAVPIP